MAQNSREITKLSVLHWIVDSLISGYLPNNGGGFQKMGHWIGEYSVSGYVFNDGRKTNKMSEIACCIGLMTP